tara:strand:+ start:183 stop:626 length:444 start_codon:yes stop_codon:yes gene_type:complete
MKKSILIVMALSFFGAIALQAANASDMTIDMLNTRNDGEKMVYSVDVARIDVGDTITWLPTEKGHNVEFKVGPKGWKAPKKSPMNREVEMTFDMPGIYFYQCTPHKNIGMIGLVIVGDDVSNKGIILKKSKAKGKSKKKLKGWLDEL